MTPSIQARNLTLRYGDVSAVDDLSFTLAGRKIHGLLGRNGSGKTSLLSVLAAFRRATAGEALLDGQPIFENAAAVSQICLIREAGDTIENDWPGDCVENALRFAAAVRPHWDDDYAARLVERFELPLKTRVGELSRGRRSALGIVLGLASRAPLTMFDESYLGLDAPARYAFYDELLADFMAHPRTIVVSTHLIEEVSSLFDEVLIIDRGRLLLQSSAEDLRARGATVIGPEEAVDRFTDGLEVLNERSLGPTKSATVYGQLDDAQTARATDAGLQLGPVTLQDLFVQLTERAGGSR